MDVNRAGVAGGDETPSSDPVEVPGESVKIGSDSGFGIWVAVIVALALAGIFIPLALRRRRDAVGAAPVGMAGSALLHELQGNAPGQTWPLGAAEVRLGRKRDENDIHLKGRSASRRMAVIRAYESGHTLYSLSPNNPAIINGAPIAQQKILQNGDLIQLGESQFRYEG